jgi:hypothetical protein
MANSARQGGVDTVAKKGAETAHVPDTEPYPPPAGSPTSQFEAASFEAVRGGPGNAHAGHPGHGHGTGVIGLSDKAAPRGHREVNFAAVKGHGVAKRSAGKATPKGVEGGRLE